MQMALEHNQYYILSIHSPELSLSSVSCPQNRLVKCNFFSVADMSVVICDKPEKAQILLKNCEHGKTPCLKTIILMDLFDKELNDRAAKVGVEILALQEVEVGD